MGRAIVRAAHEFEALRIVAAVASPGSSAIGRDVGELAESRALGIPVEADLAAAVRRTRADVVVDFSHADVLGATLGACVDARVALLVGTTGFDGATAARLADAGSRIPLLVAPNTSFGVAVLVELVREAAARLPNDFDLEIIEAHHRDKKDAPSGTALALGRAAAAGRGVRFEDVAAPARQGLAARKPGEIGLASIRGGDIVGEHRLVFAGAGERVVLEHVATDRAIFARGALRAAAWLVGQSPGQYAMRDVLGFRSKT